MREHEVTVEINLFTLQRTTFMARARIKLSMKRVQGKPLTLAHDRNKKYCIASAKDSPHSSLWFCIYTLQYSAKKQNVQLHKYKLLPPCLMAETFRNVHHNAVMNPAQTKRFKTSS